MTRMNITNPIENNLPLLYNNIYIISILYKRTYLLSFYPSSGLRRLRESVMRYFAQETFRRHHWNGQHVKSKARYNWLSRSLAVGSSFPSCRFRNVSLIHNHIVVEVAPFRLWAIALAVA